MVAQAFVRQFAAGQKIDLDVADQEVVLHYALARLNEIGLVGYPPGEPTPGPYFEIEFALPRFRYSSDDNFSGTVEYRHANGEGTFELQISYRLDPILEPVDLTLQAQSYFAKAGEECGVPRLFGVDPYEMIGEKIMACNRRQGGSSKDVYDLDLWARRPFDEHLVRRLAVLKAWTDRRGQPRYDPTALLAAIEPQNFRWSDISGLVPRDLAGDPELICKRVRTRFGFLAELSEDEEALLDDQVAHREHRIFSQLKEQAREIAAKLRG